MTTAVTAALLRENFPEFASTTAYPPAVVTFWIAAADMMLSTTRWGRARELGIQLYAAHNLAIERAAMNAAAAGGVPGVASGAVASKSVGPGSISYDTGSSAEKDAGAWNQTIYGQRLWQMIQMFGAGPIQIGIGCAPVGFFTGGAWPGPAPWPLPSGTGFSS